MTPAAVTFSASHFPSRRWLKAVAAVLMLFFVLANGYADLQSSCVSDDAKAGHCFSIADTDSDNGDTEKLSALPGHEHPAFSRFSSSGHPTAPDVHFGSHIRPPDGRPPNLS
ncbi:MAG: hypothetical protein AB1710_09810 [Pseudomonadota bacterium]|jgi:hypothetical protein